VAGDDGWTGENTDGDGLVLALRHGPGFDPAGARCVVVGAGGAARSVVLALALAGAAEVVVVNRSRERAEVAAALAGPVGRVGEPADAGTAALVVHATPVGMAGSGGAGAGGDPAPWPLDPALLGPGQVAVDLVYHPRTTPWLAAVAGRGATVANGLGMLVHQAALQVERWTGRDAPVAAMWAAVAGSDASSGG
jgi:shikimate dehydrogenase